jgi:hypothetical protein
VTLPKSQDSRAAYPNSKFLDKSISKNGNGEGSMGSKSKRTRLRSVQPLFSFSTRKSKMENAPDIKSKSVDFVENDQ